jgi:hypothetical protein
MEVAGFRCGRHIEDSAFALAAVAHTLELSGAMLIILARIVLVADLWRGRVGNW